MLGSVVFGYLVILSFVTARINVTVSKKIYNVQAGDDVTLECLIYSDDGPLDYVYWENGRREVVYSSDRGTDKKYSGSSKADPSLTIHSTTASDIGYYNCVGSKGTSRESSGWIYLHVVEDKPFTASIRPDSTDITVQEGHSVKARTCEADGCPPGCVTQWTLPNGEQKTSAIFTRPVTREQAGKYTCTAISGGYRHVESFYVTVNNYGPKDISLFPPGDVSVQEGGRINVSCQASCSPSCDIYWTGPNTYKAGKRGANLSIRSADKTDRGVYVCTASNDYGNISTSLRVTVNYAGSDIKLVPNDTHYSYKEGTVLPDIQCEAECNPACNMSWYHDRTGRILKGSQLSLKSMERSKDGNYLCNATNRLGTQILSLTIMSLFPPEILRKDLLNTSYIVDMWDSIVSSISVDASPLPDADLVHVEDNQQVTTKVELTSQRQPDVYRTKYSFSIRNITYSDVGHYTLTVSNSQGNFTYRFSINFIHEELLSDAVPTPVILVGISVLAVIIVILIVVLIIVVRRKINKEKRAKESGESDDGLSGAHNALYGQQDIAPAGLLGFPQQPADNAEGFVEIHDAEGRPNPVNDVYAEVVKPRRNNRAASVGTSNEYATVTKPSVTDRAKSSGPREIHNRVPTPTAGNGQNLQTPRTTNKDGLIYLEVDFTKKTEGEEAGKVTILGIENKCDYGQIDFSKKITLPEDMGN